MITLQWHHLIAKHFTDTSVLICMWMCFNDGYVPLYCFGANRRIIECRKLYETFTFEVDRVSKETYHFFRATLTKKLALSHAQSIISRSEGKTLIYAIGCTPTFLFKSKCHILFVLWHGYFTTTVILPFFSFRIPFSFPFSYDNNSNWLEKGWSPCLLHV